MFEAFLRRFPMGWRAARSLGLSRSRLGSRCLAKSRRLSLGSSVCGRVCRLGGRERGEEKKVVEE
jgi:hypothetical protein